MNRIVSLRLCALTVVVATSLFAAARSADVPRTGADVFRTYCAVCHESGWQGAPIANDAGEWKTRLSAGADAMFKNAKQGLNGMPAMGTCMDCSDEELQRAIAEMLP